METLIHADIFFFVTTIALVLIASLFIVVIIYVVRILHDFRYISGVIRKEADLIAEDLKEMREKAADNTGVFGGLYSIISGLLGGLGERSKGRKNKKTK